MRCRTREITCCASGSDPDARQITFDAGSKGGNHGHFDLLNFELFGYGKPLIADPGLVRYDNSSDRKWAISTPAHNTVDADGLNVGALDDFTGNGNAGVVVDQWSVGSTSAQVTAHHFGYGYLSGRPVIGRSIWYDLDGTMLVVDWAEGNVAYKYTTSFLLNGASNTSNLAGGTIQSTNSGGNVKIQSLLHGSDRIERITLHLLQPPSERKRSGHAVFRFAERHVRLLRDADHSI